MPLCHPKCEDLDECCAPPTPTDSPHVLFTGLQASTLLVPISLPAVAWTNVPLATGTLQQFPIAIVPSIVTVNATVAAERLSAGVLQFRLLVDGVVVSVGSFESEDAAFAPDITTVALTWGGFWAVGTHSVAVQYQNIETVAPFPQFAALTARAAGQGAFLTTFFLPFAPL